MSHPLYPELTNRAAKYAAHNTQQLYAGRVEGDMWVCIRESNTERLYHEQEERKREAAAERRLADDLHAVRAFDAPKWRQEPDEDVSRLIDDLNDFVRDARADYDEQREAIEAKERREARSSAGRYLPPGEYDIPVGSWLQDWLEAGLRVR